MFPNIVFLLNVNFPDSLKLLLSLSPTLSLSPRVYAGLPKNPLTRSLCSLPASFVPLIRSIASSCIPFALNTSDNLGNAGNG